MIGAEIPWYHTYNATTRHHMDHVPQMTAFCWRFVLVCVRKPRSILRSSICFVEFIGVAWQVTMRFNDMPLLHAAAEGLWSTSQTRSLQKMGRSDSVLSSWFCHLDNSSGGRKLLDFCTYRSDGIQFPMELQRTLVCFQIALTICRQQYCAKQKEQAVSRLFRCFDASCR